MTKAVPQTDPAQNVQDDLQRRNLEMDQRIEALEQRLRRSRADFQEFTSRVAHDLREPLRTVGIYAQLVSTKPPGDEDAALYLSYIQDAVERAQTLLAAMTEYAALDAEPRRPVPVEMNAVFDEVLRRIQLPAGAAVTSDPLPAVIGEFELLVKILRQLIDNALKFAGRPDPVVHVFTQVSEGDCVISVRDNGPGIDPAHHQRVFDLFRRLHGRDYPGTGMGLAYARSAIEALGGRIWVESTPGQGSTFSFSLPPA